MNENCVILNHNNHYSLLSIETSLGWVTVWCWVVVRIQ